VGLGSDIDEDGKDGRIVAQTTGKGDQMKAKVDLPKAFSVRDDHEFLPFQHLLGRMNPQLRVRRVATGVHVDGGGTVFWGLVYLEGEPPSKKKVEIALREAGFDFVHNVVTQTAFVRTDHSDRKKKS
jgi:hypothetical protein